MAAGEALESPVLVRNMVAGEYPAVKEIVARSFGDHLRENPGAMEEYQDEPWYDPEHLLVAEIDGRLVSQMGVREGTLWICGRGFQAGLVGTVCTLPEYRGRGIGATMLKAAGDWMAGRNIAMSYLHTSEARYAFYGRAGYRLGVIDQPKTILRDPKGRAAGAGESTCRPRRASPADAVACNRVYEAHFGRMTGAWSRSHRFWGRRLQGKPKLWFTGIIEYLLVEDPEPIGYVATTRSDGLKVIELATLPGRLDVVGPLLRAAVDGADGPVTTSIGRTDPLWPALAPFDPEDQTASGRVLLRIEDASGFRAAVTPLLSARADDAGLSCTAQLRSSYTEMHFGSGSRPLVFSVADNDLCALVYNGRLLPELRDANEIAVEAGSEDDLAALFPNTHPARCPVDGF